LHRETVYCRSARAFCKLPLFAFVLGKHLAGQLFDVVFHADGRVEMLPVRVAAMTREVPLEWGSAPDGCKPPGGYESCSQWAWDNRDALETYAQGIEQHGTAADQLQRFLADPAAAVAP
jgi:hypothetical protein